MASIQNASALRPDDRHTGAFTQFQRATAVIEMAVREPDRLQVELTRLHGGQQAVDLTAGVDEGGCVRSATPDQRSVLRERRDRDDLELEHGSMLSQPR